MTGHFDAKFQIAGLKFQIEFTFKKLTLLGPGLIKINTVLANLTTLGLR